MVRLTGRMMGENKIYQMFRQETWFSETLAHLSERYRAIEERMLESLRYVDLDPRNSLVFSYEYASLLRDTGSVFSSVMDSLVRESKTGTAKKEYNMSDYKEFLIEEASFDKIHEIAVELVSPRIERFLVPYASLRKKEDIVEWWRAFNNVKHSDIDKRNEGNLTNVLNALAALYVLLRLSGEEKSWKEEPSTGLFGKVHFGYDAETFPHLLFFRIRS